MTQKFANAARAYLASTVSDSATTVTIDGGGSLFPAITSPEFSRAVLQDASGIEVVLITAHTANSNSFTVTRGQEGTTARSFAAGSVFGIRMTAADGDTFVAKVSGPSSATDNAVARFDGTTGKLIQNSNITVDDSGNLTYSAGTANGVAYLNGSKVLTTGSALTFDGTNLGVGTSNPAAFGLFTINGASASVNMNATTGSAALKFYEGSGTGRGSIASLNGSDGLAFLQGATEGMRLTSTGLGIGTSSPEQRLDLGNGNIRFGASLFSGAGVSTGDVAFEVGGNRTGSGNAYIDLHAVNGTDFQSRILRLGGANGALQVFNTGTGDFRIRQDAAAPIIFDTSAAERMRIDGAGNVGIGTSSPVANSVLQVQKNNAYLTVTSNVGSGGVSTNPSLSFGINFGWNRSNGGGESNIVYGTGTGGSAGLQFASWDGTTYAERARITATGLFGLGVVSPQAMFDLAGDYKEGVVTANTGTSYTINTATGTVQILTLTGNCTFTFPTAVAGESFTLLLRQDGTGSRTVTWPAAVRWPGGTAPTITATASQTDKYVFTSDGTRWYGSNAGQAYAA